MTCQTYRGDDAKTTVHPGVTPTEATTKPNVTDASANVASSTVAANAAETSAAASTTAPANTDENSGAKVEDIVQDSERVEQLERFLETFRYGRRPWCRS